MILFSFRKWGDTGRSTEKRYAVQKTVHLGRRFIPPRGSGMWSLPYELV